MLRAFLATVLLALALPVLCAAPEARKSVLLLFDEDKDFPGLAAVNRSLQEAFRAGLRGDVEFYSESLNLSKFDGPGYDALLVDYYRRKYSGKKIDLVVGVMGPSLDFLVRHGEELFPGVPVVFCGAETSELARLGLRPNFTGVAVTRTFLPTAELAKRLQPGLRHLYVVGGSSPFDLRLQDIARRELPALGGGVSVEWLTGLTMEALLQRLASLPPQSAVLHLSLFSDAAGHAYVPHETIAAVARRANAPVYVAVDQYVGEGAIGGHVYSLSSHGRDAATAGLRILGGATPAELPRQNVDFYQDLFDWRELQRWRIDSERLPQDSIVIARLPSLWEQYKVYILAGLFLVVTETALMMAALFNLVRRRRADAAFHDSERRRRKAEVDAQHEREELAHAQRAATMGELTASIAHELNHPLGSILMNAEAARMLLSQERPAERPEVDAALGDIIDQADRAGKTIRRLQALFRKQTEHARLDLNALVADVLGLLEADFRMKRVHVRFTGAEPAPFVVGDPVQLRQVVVNLVVNATDAIVAAGEQGLREIRIETSLAAPGYVAITVADTGIGAREEDLERMFEHFVTTKAHGLGMGLAISRRIIEAHRGLIWATRNTEGAGLTLHVKLPLAPAEAASEVAGAARA